MNSLPSGPTITIKIVPPGNPLPSVVKAQERADLQRRLSALLCPIPVGWSKEMWRQRPVRVKARTAILRSAPLFYTVSLHTNLTPAARINVQRINVQRNPQAEKKGARTLGEYPSFADYLAAMVKQNARAASLRSVARLRAKTFENKENSLVQINIHLNPQAKKRGARTYGENGEFNTFPDYFAASCKRPALPLPKDESRHLPMKPTSRMP